MKKIDELKASLREKADRLGELSQVRELSDAQKAEVAQLEREYKNISHQLEVEIREAQAKALEQPAPQKSLGEQLREIAQDALDHKQAREISLSVLTEHAKNNIVSAGAQETTIFGLLPLLEKGLIWGQVGMKVQTGVTGNLLWPYATTNVEVEERAEAAALNDKDINFDNKTATPYSSGITIKVTNEAIDEATFDLAGFVQTQMGLAVMRYLNKKTFSPANWSGLAGPYKNANPAQLVATYKNIKEQKALIAATGVDMSGFAYVMDNKTRALLESTPKAVGQGGFILENGKIDGDPVYVTEYINTKADGTQQTGEYRLEMGCWNYLAANQHGEVRFTIDPLTLASSNETKFVLHTKWSLTNLALADAFKIFKLVEAPVSSSEL
jgi:HK97 family phage major capsid protein